MPAATVTAFAPGRVNLIGDHTDYAGGLALPMAIDLGTTVSGTRGGDAVELRSDQLDEPALVPLDVSDPSAVQPEWARYVAAVVARLQPRQGLAGTVTSTLPTAAGLSSSAALEIAVALALGFDGSPVELARLTQAAEQEASGVPCGIMDQLVIASAQPGHALRIDFTAFETAPVPMPAELEVVVVHSGQARTLATSAYAERAQATAAAAAIVGPLRDASRAAVERIQDPILRRRARHVVSENERVDAFCAALTSGDRTVLAEAMAASHASLRDDFEVSTPALDDLVATLVATEGVVGARLTGAGFGGCVVALVEPGTPLPEGRRAWRVHPSGAAHLT